MQKQFETTIQAALASTWKYTSIIGVYCREFVLWRGYIMKGMECVANTVTSLSVAVSVELKSQSICWRSPASSAMQEERGTTMSSTSCCQD